MEASVIERRNRQKISKLNSLIQEYQAKLDSRVDQVVSQMMTYSKKVSEEVNVPLSLPQISTKKHNSSHFAGSASRPKLRKHQNKDRNKSMSANFEQNNSTFQNYQNHFETLKSSFKKTEIGKINQAISVGGRAVGNQKVVRPKFWKKQPQILSKELRLNPFCERNAIKAFELDKGVLSLIQKGKIGKDINIISAFQKGKPILQFQKAIFHQGEQRFAQLQSQKIQLPPAKDQKQFIIKTQQNLRKFNQNWAITMPHDNTEDNSVRQPFQQAKKIQRSRIQDIDFSESIFLKILHFQTVRDDRLELLKKKNISQFCEIKQILLRIQKLAEQYSLSLIYIDSKKMLRLLTLVRRVSKEELEDCIVKPKGARHRKAFCAANMSNQFQKKIKASDIVKSCLRTNLARVYFLTYLKKKKVSNNLYRWAVNSLTVKRFKLSIQQKRKKQRLNFVQLQSNFRQNFKTLTSGKHYEIHIANELLRNKQAHRSILNTQLTRIFNLENVNCHIVYILPYKLDSQTLNYYYKIMELEEIPNYKDRVSFMEADPKMQFKNQQGLSSKLYYNSDVLRKLKRKIKDYPAYFCISYPSLLDIDLANYLSIPILSGNLLESLQTEKRSQIQEAFRMPHIKCFYIAPGKYNLTALSDELIAFCQSLRHCTKFILKINTKYQSSGLGLLAAPFNSLPEMFENTNLVLQQKVTVDEFYHQIIKLGGIIQKYEENVAAITVVGKINQDGESKIIGTFDKVSTGFINIGYMFPQATVDHELLMNSVDPVAKQLCKRGHFGPFQLTFYVDEENIVYLEKVQCYFTSIGSSLYYFNFLSQGYLNTNGEFMAKIIDTYEGENNKQEQIVSLEPRCFTYLPFLLHFGLSERQCSSFFQLCRMGGVSFDLQNKFGATFILLGSLRSSMGLITTARERRTSIQLMLKSLDFILKQNSHNMSNQVLKQKQVRMRQRENIISIKQRLQDYF